MNAKIEHINISVTNQCNLHCKQCSIWNESPKYDLSPESVENILRSQASDMAGIALTGGEPFLHEEFADIVGIVLQRKPEYLKNITTNGTLADPMLALFERYGQKLSRCSLHVSLDGINCHDRQRGQSLDLIRRNISVIRERFPEINIRLKFTITKLNYTDIIPTYEYAKQNRLGFKIKLAENAQNYTNRIFGGTMSEFTVGEEKAIARDLFKIYKELKDKNNTDALFISKTIDFLLQKGGKGFCKTPFNRIFVMQDGEVYSCIHYQRIGNIHQNTLDEIWLSQQAHSIRAEIDRHGCGKCVAYHGYSPD